MSSNDLASILDLLAKLDATYATLIAREQPSEDERARLLTVASDFRWYAGRFGPARWNRPAREGAWDFTTILRHVAEQAATAAASPMPLLVRYCIDHGKEHIGQIAELWFALTAEAKSEAIGMNAAAATPVDGPLGTSVDGPLGPYRPIPGIIRGTPDTSISGVDDLQRRLRALQVTAGFALSAPTDVANLRPAADRVSGPKAAQFVSFMLFDPANTPTLISFAQSATSFGVVADLRGRTSTEPITILRAPAVLESAPASADEPERYAVNFQSNGLYYVVASWGVDRATFLRIVSSTKMLP